MSSKHLTAGQKNSTRLAIVCVDLNKLVLKDILSSKIKPEHLYNAIKSCDKLTSGNYKLNKEQLSICYLTPPNVPDYDKFDITLLCSLLRNLCPSLKPTLGWGKTPSATARKIGDEIERIREFRNEVYGHCASWNVNDTEFTKRWTYIKTVIKSVQTLLPSQSQSADYEKELQKIEDLELGPEDMETYKQRLEAIMERLEKTEEKVEVLYERLEETEEKVEALDDEMKKVIPQNVRDKMKKLTESVIPENVRDQYDIDIQKWREEDKLYYETHSFHSVMAKVRNQPCITFVGGSGSGKSATAHHIALKLQEEGYEVVPTKDVRKIEDYGDPRNPQVFVIDDVMGVFGLQKTKLDVLTDYEQKITKPCMVKSKTLMTCREAVFNETLPYKPFLTKEETLIRLNSFDHKLDNNDKKQILQKYGLNADLMSPALLKSTHRMFPLLCKLFSKETKFQALGNKFFLNPVQSIIHEIDEMQRHNKLNYATLVLCMLNENSLARDILEDENNENFQNMKKTTLGNCKLESPTDNFKFMDALSAMEGTYTKQSGAKFTFIHDSMFEACAYHYGQQFPDQVLLYMSSSYIANSVKPQTSEPGIAPKVKEKQSDSQSSKGDKSGNDSDRKKESNDKSNEREESIDLCIRLREDQYPLLAQRLYRDIQNMELYDVFRNPVLKHPQVCQAFIGVLETKSYTELKSLFLSCHGKVDKVVSKRKCVEKEREEFWIQEVLMDQREKRDDKGKMIGYTYNVRVISWVIYYGHHQIIEYIIQQTAQHNETSELCEITVNSPHQSKFEIFKKMKNIFSNREQKIERRRLLVLSCYSGDVQTLRALLPVCKETINGQDLVFHTPLTVACEGGHVDMVKELLKVGADVNLQSGGWNTPLIAACKGGHVSVVVDLVKAGADVNVQVNGISGYSTLIGLVSAWTGEYMVFDRGNTPLIAACKGGHVSVVVELVKAGADVNLQRRQRNTLLMELIGACTGKYEGVVGDRGNTPLIAACEGGHMSVVVELVKAGADVNLQAGGNTLLIAACKGGHMGVVEGRGNTPLTAACEGGHVSVVVELVKAGADVNLQRRRRNTLLMELIAVCKGGHMGVVEERGNTPLTAACEGGHMGVVEVLVKAGINLQDDDGNTTLIAAVTQGSLSTVKCLVEHRADWVTQVVDFNVSAVYTALILNKPDIVKCLIQQQNKTIPGKLTRNVHLFECLVEIRHAGVKTDSRDDVVTDRSVWCMDRRGGLWRTISEGDCDVLRHLDVNQSIQLYDEYIDDKSDVRPLLYTLIDVYVKHGTEKVSILLGAGADVNVRVRYREYGSVLDREGVSVLERTRRWVCQYSESERYKYRVPVYKEVMCEIKKHVRRYSV